MHSGKIKGKHVESGEDSCIGKLRVSIGRISHYIEIRTTLSALVNTNGLKKLKEQCVIVMI